VNGLNQATERLNHVDPKYWRLSPADHAQASGTKIGFTRRRRRSADRGQSGKCAPAVANTAPAAAKPADLSLKVNADGTTGPHHKPRHPKLPGSFHV
jgi:hypothetical protein